MTPTHLDVFVGETGLPLDYATHRTAILAKPRVGKSNAAVRIAEEMTRHHVPWVAIDPKGDWWGVRSSGDGKQKGLSVPIFGGDHGDIPIEPTAGKVIGELIAEKRLSCLLDVSGFDSRQQCWGFLNDLGLALLRRNKDPLHLFLDECDEYLPQKVSDGGMQPKALSTWNRVVSKGGQKGMGVTLISQRSAFVNKDVLWIVDAMIAFNTFSPKDRETVSEWFAAKGADARVFADSLKTLEKGEAWLYGPGWLNDDPQKVRFQRRTTFDSGATPEVGKSTVRPATVADVDLAALGEQIAATVERVKADDPEALRAEIERLKQVAARVSREAAAAARTPTPEAERAYEAMVAAREAYEAELASLRATRARWKEEAGALSRVVEVLQGVRAILAEEPSTVEVEPQATRAQGSSRAGGRGVQFSPAMAPAAPATPPQPVDGLTIGKGERTVLGVLAEYPEGRTQDELAFLAGYSAKASTIGVILSNLRKQGLAEPGQPIRLTEAGMAAAGGPVARPRGPELLEHWLRHPKVGGGERKVLLQLIQDYPAAPSHADLCESTGYSPGASTMGVILSNLRKLGLVSKGERKVVDEFMAAIA